jgi:hypothetical protein
MLAIFLDVHNEVQEMARECEVMKRKLERFHRAADSEDKDSHLRAIAGCIHGIYTGIEKTLKGIIKYFDGELPVGDDWHIQLLLRARYPNESVRPAVISEETFHSLDSLRGFRHIFRGTYHTNLIPDLTIARADEMEKAFSRFSHDLQVFETSVTALPYAAPPLGQ